jgi:RNA polymerase sigma-70 factor, ECF subfamily
MSRDSDSFRRDLVALLPRLRRFALALSGRRETAEDLLQSAIERALLKWTSFERGRRLDSWMFKIMQNLWFDMRRSSAAENWVSDEGVDVVGEDGQNVVESRDELRRIKEAFANLPEDQRAVMALVVLEGFSYADAASALDVPIGTVMSRLSRARATLAMSTGAPRALTQFRNEG